jgi:hypothetical protein
VWNDANDWKFADANHADTASVDVVLNDVGNMQLTVGSDEAAAEFLVDGNHVRFYIADQLVYTALIEPPVKTVEVDPFAAKQVINLNLRGHIASWEAVPVQPYGGLNAKPQSLDRPHKWSSPETDITSWDDAVVRYTALAVPWASPQTDPPWMLPWYAPKGFMDPDASWLSSRAEDPDNPDPVGESLFVVDVDFPTDGLYEFQIAADDGFDFDIDGITVGSGAVAPADSFITAWRGCWELSAGTHRVGIVLKNYERPVTEAVGTFGGPNRMRLAFVAYDRTDTGVNALPSAARVVARSDGTSGWKCLDYPTDWPAPTDGAVIGIHHSEAQDEGALTDETLGFDDDVDTAGNAWVDNGAQSFQVDSDNLLTILQTMANARRIDFEKNPASKTLNAWNSGSKGSVHAATWNVGTGLFGFTSETQPITNSLQVRHKTGRFILEDSASIATHGLLRKSLVLADLDEAAARAQAQRDLDVMSTPRSTYEVALELGPETVGTADAPFGDGGVWLGDSPTVNGLQLRMVRCTVQVDAAGWPTFVPVFETRQQSLAERQEILLGKVTGGTLNGKSRAATPVDGLTQGVSAGFAQKADLINFHQDILTPSDLDSGLQTYYNTSIERTWETLVQVHRIDIRQSVLNTDRSTKVELWKTGMGTPTLVFTAELPAGHYRVPYHPEYLFVGEQEALHAVWVQYDDPTGDPFTDYRWCNVDCFAIEAHPAVVQPPQVDVPWQ